MGNAGNHFHAFFLSLLLLGCNSSEPAVKPGAPVVLPDAELEALRARIKGNLEKVDLLCQQNNISAQDIQAAFLAVDWGKSSEERLAQMPSAIRETMVSVQKDLERYGDLVVFAHDRAEGRKLVEAAP